MRPIIRETIVERRQPQMRWSAVFAGAVVSVGLWVLLQMLGTGIGLAAIDTNDPHSLRGIGIGTGIWSVIAPLLSLFAGGMVAGRLATTVERSVGGLHGLVVWALTSVAGVFAVISLIAALATSAIKIGGNAVELTGNALSSAASGIDANELLGPVNDKLQQEGKPTVTADQLAAAARGVAQHGMRQGHVDHQVLVDELAHNTQLTPDDAQDIVNRFGDRYERAIGQLQQTGERAQGVALGAGKGVGKGLFWGGIGLLVALIAAVGGGLLGVRKRAPVVVESEPPPA